MPYLGPLEHLRRCFDHQGLALAYEDIASITRVSPVWQQFLARGCVGLLRMCFNYAPGLSHSKYMYV